MFVLTDDAGETDTKQEPKPPEDLSNEEEEEDSQNTNYQPDNMTNLPVNLSKL